ncbi:MAG: radical SAM protein [Syntrophorhabdaceae bacterium]
MKLYSDGVIDDRLESLISLANPCRLCPRKCMADRAHGDLGFCGAPYDLYVASAAPHFGEEAPLVGQNGSGTIFMTHCNLRCSFCQNYEISIHGEGISCSPMALAHIMIDLQNKGCHNINLVTPTHYIHQIVKALPLAIEKGLNIPLVYNTGGYDSIDVIKFLEGIIDIYMPDIKFMDPNLASRYCRAPDYPDIVKGIVKEMFGQVGDLTSDESGIGEKGLIIRHLQMPAAADDSKAIIDFVADSLSGNSYLNIMSQYYPCHLAGKTPEIARKITAAEHRIALDYARLKGLIRATH